MAAVAGPDMSIPMLNCGVCRSMFRQPRLLSCLHTFCHPCLYELPEVCNNDNESFIRCPQCHKPTFLHQRGISGLVHNDFLSRMCQDYVNEVQKTLGSSSTRAIGSGGSSPSQSPVSPSSYTRGQFGSSQQGNYSSRLYEGTQSPKSLPGAAFTYDFQRDFASSSDAYQQAERRASVERIPLRARQRKMSMTPPEVLRIWENLQRKLNHLQSASVQITYGLDNIKLAESNWFQRKQDLRREVQRRTAQLQFFIKRQERLLLAMLDSKDTDDSFLKVADQARNDMRSNLKSVVHEAEVVKSVLDLAVDSELLTLGSLLLGNATSQHPVSMEVPELHFKMPPDELSVEDKMGEDFGCFSSITVLQDVYTPEILELEIVEVEDSAKRKIEEEKETVVTETYTTYVPPPPVTENTSVTASVSETVQQVTELQPQPEIREEGPEEEEEEEEEEESEEESEESEEEMIVEETIEIVNGKMTVVSSSRKPAPKEEKKPKREKRPRKKIKKTDDTKLSKPEEPRMPSPRGRDTHTRRTVNSAAAATAAASSVSRSEQPPAPASVFTFQEPAAPITQQMGPPSDSSISSSTSLSQSRDITSKSSEVSRPTSLSFGASRYSSQNEAQSIPTRKVGRVEDKPAAEITSPRDSGSKTPSEEHQSTLSKFQNFRETLKKKRRELLDASIGSGHPGISSILARERRVQSLDRRASLREIIQHPLSPDTEDKPGLPGDAAHLTQGSNESGQVDDPHADSASVDKDSDSSGTSTDKKSRPVRRAVSAASDKATKMEFLRETWKKRKELLIQTDAYITTGAGAESKEEGEEEEEGASQSASSPDDPRRSRAARKARSRLTDVSQALTGIAAADGGMEPVLQHDTLQEDYPTEGHTSTATAESPAETQAMKTVDRILQKKNVPILSPRSPTRPASPTSQSPPLPLWLSKPSMVVRPRPRETTTTTTTTTTATTAAAAAASAATFVPTQLETLQEDETKASPEQKRGLRTTSPSRAEGGSTDTLQQQSRAIIRRKKERWRSLSLT